MPPLSRQNPLHGRLEATRVRGRHRDRDLGAGGVRRVVRRRPAGRGAGARRGARRGSGDRLSSHARDVRDRRDRADDPLGRDRARHDRERVHVGFTAAAARAGLGRSPRPHVEPSARGDALRSERPRGRSGDALGPLRRACRRRGGGRATLRARPRHPARRGRSRAPHRQGGPLVLGRRPFALPRPGRVCALRGGGAAPLPRRPLRADRPRSPRVLAVAARSCSTPSSRSARSASTQTARRSCGSASRAPSSCS